MAEATGGGGASAVEVIAASQRSREARGGDLLYDFHCIFGIDNIYGKEW